MTEKKQTDPMEEKQELSVNVKLGRTHFEALRRWSKERFGLANQAAFLRIIINERWQAEQKESAEREAVGQP